MNFNAYAFSHIVHLFVSLALHGNAGNAIGFAREKNLSQALSNSRNMRQELRALANDGGINIDNAPMGIVKLLNGRFKKLRRISSAPLLISIRKVRSNIPQRGGAEESIDYRMDKRISIRMPLKPFFVWNLHTAED